MPLTLLLDFIRQIGTVRQTTATEYLPENGENRRGDLPAGSVRIGEGKKKARGESGTFLPTCTPTLLKVTAAADFNVT